MMNFAQILESPEHHAYIVHEDVPGDLVSSPAEGLYVVRAEGPLTVSDVSWIRDAALTTVSGHSRRVVIDVPSVTYQTQNALLKILEDVQGGVYFYICIPKSAPLLPTFTSRCVVIDAPDAGTASKPFMLFLKSTPADRLKELDRVWGLGTEERAREVSSLQQNLELHVRSLVSAGDSVAVGRARKALAALQDSQRNGAMHKQTLHTLAFI